MRLMGLKSCDGPRVEEANDMSSSSRFRLLEQWRKEATALSLVTCSAAVTSFRLLPERSIKHIENETESLSQTEFFILFLSLDSC